MVVPRGRQPQHQRGPPPPGRGRPAIQAGEGVPQVVLYGPEGARLGVEHGVDRVQQALRGPAPPVLEHAAVGPVGPREHIGRQGHAGPLPIQQLADAAHQARDLPGTPGDVVVLVVLPDVLRPRGGIRQGLRQHDPGRGPEPAEAGVGEAAADPRSADVVEVHPFGGRVAVERLGQHPQEPLLDRRVAQVPPKKSPPDRGRPRLPAEGAPAIRADDIPVGVGPQVRRGPGVLEEADEAREHVELGGDAPLVAPADGHVERRPHAEQRPRVREPLGGPVHPAGRQRQRQVAGDPHLAHPVELPQDEVRVARVDV